MQRYETYKPMGLAWLENVPDHWEVFPFKGLFRMSDEKNGKSVVGQMLSVSGLRGIEIKQYEFEEQKRSEFELRDYRVVRPGQLVVNTMWLNYAGLGVSEYEGHVSPAYRSYWFDSRLRPRYVHYLMRSHPYVQGYTGQMQGIRPNSMQIKNCDFTKIPVLVPPHDEQDKIVSFLDEKSAEINAAIAKKERLIELLNEQRNVLVKVTVFGLKSADCNHTPAIPWIEKLPEHWGAKRAKYLFSQSRLPVMPSYEVVTAYRDGEVTLRSNRRLDGYTFAVLEQGYQGVKPGQLVINSMDAFAGAIGVSDSEGKCSPEYVICNPIDDKEISPHFAALVLRQMALSGYIEVICSAVRQRALRIRYNDFAPLMLPVPPINEQRAIVRSVDEIQAHHEVLLQQLRREIEGLKEFLLGLIANVVTGQIRI